MHPKLHCDMVTHMFEETADHWVIYGYRESDGHLLSESRGRDEPEPTPVNGLELPIDLKNWEGNKSASG